LTTTKLDTDNEGGMEYPPGQFLYIHPLHSFDLLQRGFFAALDMNRSTDCLEVRRLASHQVRNSTD
jgi:hypothetical protein